MYQVSDHRYVRKICVKNLPNSRDQTQSPQFSSNAIVLISSGSNDSSCPRLCPCDQTTVQKHGLPTRLCTSDTQSEEKASRTKTQRKLGLDDSISVDEDPPPEGSASLEDGDYSDPCIVCMERPPDSILLECGHAGLCVGCATVLWDQARRCPLCRQEFAAIMRIVAREAPRTVRAL